MEQRRNKKSGARVFCVFRLPPLLRAPMKTRRIDGVRLGRNCLGGAEGSGRGVGRVAGERVKRDSSEKGGVWAVGSMAMSTLVEKTINPQPARR